MSKPGPRRGSDPRPRTPSEREMRASREEEAQGEKSRELRTPCPTTDPRHEVRNENEGAGGWRGPRAPKVQLWRVIPAPPQADLFVKNFLAILEKWAIAGDTAVGSMDTLLFRVTFKVGAFSGFGLFCLALIISSPSRSVLFSVDFVTVAP